jgi:hypothetical protein
MASQAVDFQGRAFERVHDDLLAGFIGRRDSLPLEPFQVTLDLLVGPANGWDGDE